MKTRTTIKLAVLAVIVIIILIAGSVCIYLARIGWFEYRKNGVYHFINNDKYAVEYLLDTNEYKFEVTSNGVDSLREVDFAGGRYNIRVFYDERYHDGFNHYTVWFYFINNFDGGLYPFCNLVIGEDDKEHYQEEDKSVVAATNSDGVVKEMFNTGSGGSDGGKNVYPYSFAVDQKDQQGFVSGNFEIGISNIFVYKYTRK